MQRAAGPSTLRRSGWDDNSYLGKVSEYPREIVIPTGA